MKIAAYQAPLTVCNKANALERIRLGIEWCEKEGITLLCCPEAVLGGLADDCADPMQIAIATEGLNSVLVPLRSDTVSVIVGFTELGFGGLLYNSAVVFHKGVAIGLYRKRYPAINRSVYEPGKDTPIFQVGAVKFGIIICNDSNYVEPARQAAVQGASVLFIPTNNALPFHKASTKVADAARRCDIARAVESKMWVIRADVAGRTDRLHSYGSSEIVDPHGNVVQSARELSEDLLVMEIDTCSTTEARGNPNGGNHPSEAQNLRVLPSGSFT